MKSKLQNQIFSKDVYDDLVPEVTEKLTNLNWENFAGQVELEEDDGTNQTQKVKSEQRNQQVWKGISTIFCCNLVKRNCLWPSGWMFNDGEEVGEPIGLRKRDNQFTWIWENLHSGTWIRQTGDFTWLLTLLCWQLRKDWMVYILC